MKNILFFILLLLVFYSCEKDANTGTSPASLSNSTVNQFSATINNVSYSFVENINCSFYNNTQGESVSNSDIENNSFGIEYTPKHTDSSCFGDLSIYFSYVHNNNLVDSTTLFNGTHIFYDNSHFFNLFFTGDHYYFNGVFLNQNQPESIYIRYTQYFPNYREWTSFKSLNGEKSQNSNSNFKVNQSKIINYAYNPSAIMEMFPSVFVKGSFNCELYSLDSIEHLDSIKVENASFSGKFIEYM